MLTYSICLDEQIKKIPEGTFKVINIRAIMQYNSVKFAFLARSKTYICAITKARRPMTEYR